MTGYLMRMGGKTLDDRMQGKPMIACGVFPDQLTAEPAVLDLLNAGFKADSISVSMVDAAEARRLAEKRGVTATTGATTVPAGIPPETVQTYRDRMAKGGALISVACGNQCDKAMEILNRHGAEMTTCALQEIGTPPIILHEPDQYASMEHTPQPGEPVGKPGEFEPEFHRDDLQS
jgi:hypothetical protein